MEIKELNMDVLKSILNAYPYEVIFCDRTHTVRFINKTAKARYGDVVQVGRSILTGISATPVSLLRCRSWKQDIKTKQAAHRV